MHALKWQHIRHVYIQVDELLGRVDPGSLLRVQSGQDIARLILPIVHQIQAGQ